MHDTILVVLRVKGRKSQCHCHLLEQIREDKTHAIVVVTAIGTSGPAVISGHVSPSLHLFARAISLSVTMNDELIDVLVGAVVTIATEFTAAARQDDANPAIMASENINRIVRC